MNLRDLHNDPKQMAEFLGIPWEPQQRSVRIGYYGRSSRTETVQPETIVADAVRNIIRANETEWAKSRHNQFKPLTWTRMVQEALTALGIKGGTVAERIDRVKAQRWFEHAPTRKENWFSVAQFSGFDDDAPQRALTLNEALNYNEPQAMVA